MIECRIDHPVRDCLRHNTINGTLPIESDFASDVVEANRAVRNVDRAKARLDHVVAQPLDEGKRLVSLEGLLVRCHGILELAQVAQTNRLRNREVRSQDHAKLRRREDTAIWDLPHEELDHDREHRRLCPESKSNSRLRLRAFPERL